MENLILILGCKGMLGGQLLKVFGDCAVGWDREDCDVTDAVNLKLKIQALKPGAIINCVAYNDVDGAEGKSSAAFLLNATVPKTLSQICRQLDIALVHFSSNYVFDGQQGEYGENDQPKPLSIYGQSKYQGEQAVLAEAKKYYLIRTAVLFGPQGQSELSKKSFVQLMSDLSQKQSEIKAVSDEINSLTYVVDLARQTKLLLEQNQSYGIYHIVNAGQASWFDFAKEIFACLRKPIQVIPVSSDDFPRAAPRPKKAVLKNTKLPPLRPWQSALGEFLSFTKD